MYAIHTQIPHTAGVKTCENAYNNAHALQAVQQQLETVSAELQADKEAWSEERTQLQVHIEVCVCV
jgi:hypothetical protein